MLREVKQTHEDVVQVQEKRNISTTAEKELNIDLFTVDRFKAKHRLKAKLLFIRSSIIAKYEKCL